MNLGKIALSARRKNACGFAQRLSLQMVQQFMQQIKHDAGVDRAVLLLQGGGIGFDEIHLFRKIAKFARGVVQLILDGVGDDNARRLCLQDCFTGIIPSGVADDAVDASGISS